MTKRILAFLLCLVMLLSLTAVGVFADEETVPEEELAIEEPMEAQPEQPADEPEEEKPVEEIPDEDIVTPGEVSEDDFEEEIAYAADTVAVIGSEEYTNLTAALEAAPADSTITLLSNIAGDFTIASDKKFVLDLGGYTITGTGSTYVINNAGTVTITNGTITMADGATNTKNGGGINNTGSLTLGNGAIITGCTAKAGGGVYSSTGSSLTVLTGATVNNGTVTGKGAAIYMYASGTGKIATMTIEGGTVGDIYLYGTSSGVVENSISGGTIAKITTGSGTGSTAYVSGGTITSLTGCLKGSFTGGTFSEDPESFVADGYAAVKDVEGSTWTVQKAIQVINGSSITGCTNFSEVKAAVTAVTDGSIVTIKLLANVSVSSKTEFRTESTDTTNRNIVLDLNGCTLTNTGASNGLFLISKNTTFTITGNGKIDAGFDTAGNCSLTSYLLIGNKDSNYIIENGEFVNIPLLMGGTGSGTLTINGGTFSFINIADSGELKSTSPTLIINSGSFNIQPKDAYISSASMKSQVGESWIVRKKPVAKIEDEEYQSLAQAITAAQSGDVITLYSDAAVDTTITIDKDITIQGDGTTGIYLCVNKTADAGRAFIINENCSLSIESTGDSNLTVYGNNGNASPTYNGNIMFYVQGALTLDKVNIQDYARKNNESGKAIYVTATGLLDMSNGSISNIGLNDKIGAAVYNKGEASFGNVTFIGNKAAANATSSIVNGTDINNGNDAVSLALNNVTAENICLSADASISGKINVTKFFLYDIDDSNARLNVEEALDAGSSIGIEVVEGQAKTEGNYPNLLAPRTVVAAGEGAEASATYMSLANAGAATGGYSLASGNGKVMIVSENYFSGAGLTLNESTTLIFNVTLADGKNMSDYHVVMTRNGAETTVDPVGNSFSIGIPVKNIGDNVTAKLYNSNDELVDTLEYSVSRYCEAILEIYDTDTYYGKLAQELLDYGYAAQAYFGYEGNLTQAEDNQADIPAECNNLTKNTVSGITFTGATLLLKETTRIRIYFTVDSGAIGDYSFTCGDTSLTPVPSGNEYYVEIANIGPKNLNNAYTVKVNSNSFITYSPLTYAYRMNSKSTSSDELKELCRALYNYYLAAVAAH